MSQDDPAADPGSLIGLSWQGRLGAWKDEVIQAGIQVVAACVAVFDVRFGRPQKTASVFAAVEDEIRTLLQAQLPPEMALLALHWENRLDSEDPQPVRRLRASLSTNPPAASLRDELRACHKLQAFWQQRGLLADSVTATWRFTFDGASQDHQERVSGLLDRAVTRHRGIILELPPRWFFTEARVAISPQKPTDHWFRFASLFGQVQCAELIGNPAEPPVTVNLVVQFRTSMGAEAMYEALVDRYLLNPNNKRLIDCQAVACGLGDRDRLRKRSLAAGFHELLKGPQQPSKEPQYILERCGKTLPEGSLNTAPPDEIPLDSVWVHFTIGREVDSDIVIRHPHVSKSHATLTLLETRPGAWSVHVQDLSLNGTWVNGHKLPSNTPVQLHLGDKVSFAVPGPSLEEDPLTWELKVPKGKARPTAPPARRQEPATPGLVAKSGPSKPSRWLSDYDENLPAGALVNGDEFLAQPVEPLEVDYEMPPEPVKPKRPQKARVRSRSRQRHQVSGDASVVQQQPASASSPRPKGAPIPVAKQRPVSPQRQKQQDPGKATGVKAEGPPQPLPQSSPRALEVGRVAGVQQRPVSQTNNVPPPRPLPPWRLTPHIAPPPSAASNATLVIRGFGIREWLANMHLSQYEGAMVANFESLEQIVRLYRDNIDGFLQENAIVQEGHRAMFAASLRALGQRL